MMELKRRGDWAARLHEHVDAIKNTPFAWSNNNCGKHWAGGAVEAMTGVDVTSKYGSATTVRGLVAAMRRAGFDNVADLVAAELPEIPEGVCQARLGDIAAIPNDDAFGYTLGIVNGETILVLGEASMGHVPLFKATRAFRVG